MARDLTGWAEALAAFGARTFPDEPGINPHAGPAYAALAAVLRAVAAAHPRRLYCDGHDRLTDYPCAEVAAVLAALAPLASLFPEDGDPYGRCAMCDLALVPIGAAVNGWLNVACPQCGATSEVEAR